MAGITDLIKKHMADEKISLEAVAKKMGVSRQSVWAILNRQATATQRGKAGERELNFSTVKKLLDALGLTMEIATAPTSDPQEAIKIAEQEGVGFDAFERILGAVGFRMKIREAKEMSTVKAYKTYSSFGDSISETAHGEIYDVIEVVIPENVAVDMAADGRGHIFSPSDGFGYFFDELFFLHKDGIWMEYIDTGGNKHRKKCDYERVG